MTIKTHPLRFGQKGFTLIEIVMVLVLLGILAAVAVPKYFDLQEEAEKQTLNAIAAEFHARMNARFAQELLNGEKCSNAGWTAMVYESMNMNDENKNKFSVEGDWKSQNSKEMVLNIKLAGRDKPATFPLAMPSCDEETEN